jgi:uncharacterized protein DUF2510
MDREHRDAIATEAQRVRALAIELGGAPAARFVDGSANAGDGDAGATTSGRPKVVVTAELREAVEALTRACVAPGAKALKAGTPHSVRLGARLTTAGARRVMPRLQDHMDSSNNSATNAPIEVPRPGWFADPAERFDYRYWDGRRWTNHVSRDGTAEIDPSETLPHCHTSAPATDD